MADQGRFTLGDKYRTQEGTVILSGLQALVRLPLDQHLADQAAGLNTATFISGYRGSPLAGLDTALESAADLLKASNVVFMPAVNEDLAATAVFGSQIANLLPEPKYDGVLGMWYGKSPGVDRSGDAFKHANLAGVGRYGGVLALAGDDPTAKSSTLPSQSEIALYDAQMPILYPGSVQEVIEYGRYGFALSRYSGAWVGFKIVTDIADSFATAHVVPVQPMVYPEFTFRGGPWQHRQDARLIAPFSLQLEADMVEGRLEAARQFGAANRLNRVTASSAGDCIGIAAAGKTYYDLCEALDLLGLDERERSRYGIRLLKIGMLYPLDSETIKTFAGGLEQILVIEEKRAFLELFIQGILYNQAERPQLIGKRDQNGEWWVHANGELDVDQIAELLARQFERRFPEVGFPARLAVSQSPAPSLNIPMAAQPTLARTPYFCSGCPHNRSTVVPDGSIGAGGIGCHTMALNMERDTYTVTQMGGEGAQWVGAAPFSGTPHLFQNLGDGTLFHSGYLAIRQAVAAHTNITYKILYNSVVAMTGGQPAEGAMAVPELTRALHAEGVGKIIVCAADPGKYAADAGWAPGVEVWNWERLDEAQTLLREQPGVTVLIYDQPCAADLRRKRKRGLAEEPPGRIFINEAVCEGCGDCGVKSNCLSVVPVDTEFGRKTQIHQPSCNKDYTCLKGDCPSFLRVIPARTEKPSRAAVKIEASELPAPQRSVADDVNLYMIGIGGTGVVTVNQILATAAFLEGKTVRSLDQTGLSQKGDPVLSHLKISSTERVTSNKIGAGAADAYLVFDLLQGANDKNLSHANPKRTTAVISMSQVATGDMVRSTALAFPQQDYLKRRIDARTQTENNVYLDAVALSETLFGSHMFANMIVIGAAFQAGLIPLAASAIEQATTLNGVSVGANVQAFRVGRKLVAAPDWQPVAEPRRSGELKIAPELTAEARSLVHSVGASPELRRLLEIRVPELIAYQNAGYARQYIDFVRRVREKEIEVSGETRLSEAVARYLFKLMAYKDEYEVARLHLHPEFQAELVAQFGKGARVAYLLHPPLLRSLGLKNKIALGRWFDSGYRLLERLKFVRGTPLDIFGYAHVRRVERALIHEYRALIEGELRALSPATYEKAVRLATLPDMIRGYEHIKLDNVAKFHQQIESIQRGQPDAKASV